MKILSYQLFEASKKEEAAQLTAQLNDNPIIKGILALKPGASFVVKTSGHIHLSGIGSKTVIYPVGREAYAYKSISQGATFVDETLPSLDECLRAFYPYLLARMLTLPGITKQEIKEGIEKIGINKLLGKSKTEIETLIKQNLGVPEPPDMSWIPEELNDFASNFGFIFKDYHHAITLLDSGLTSGNSEGIPCLIRNLILNVCFGISEDETHLAIGFRTGSGLSYRGYTITHIYKGKSSIDNASGKIKISVNDTKEEIIEFLKKFIKDAILSIYTIKCFGDYQPGLGREYIEPLMDFSDFKAILKDIVNEMMPMDPNDIKESSPLTINDTLIRIMTQRYQENPLELYKLDGVPKLRDTIMQKIGATKEVVAVGRKLASGLI